MAHSCPFEILKLSTLSIDCLCSLWSSRFTSQPDETVQHGCCHAVTRLDHIAQFPPSVNQKPHASHEGVGGQHSLSRSRKKGWKIGFKSCTYYVRECGGTHDFKELRVAQVALFRGLERSSHEKMTFLFVVRNKDNEDHGEVVPALVLNIIVASLNAILFVSSTSVAWLRRKKDPTSVKVFYYGSLASSAGLSTILFTYRASHRVAGATRVTSTTCTLLHSRRKLLGTCPTAV